MDLLQTSGGMGNGRVYSGRPVRNGGVYSDGPVRNNLSPDRDEDTLHTHYRRFPFYLFCLKFDAGQVSEVLWVF